MDDWLNEALERISSLSKEELKAILDKHGVEYTEEIENERKSKESNGNC